MNEIEFIDKLTDLMDTEKEITLTTKLKDIEEWDSLSMISFFSFFSTRSSRRISPEEIKSAQTVKELFDIINKN